jgi:outer membrane protein assembly factor BamB
MSQTNRPSPAALSRRAALLLPLAATGCSLFDDWFGDKKTPLEGKRAGILAVKRGLQVDNPADRKIVIPRPTPVADSPQAGGTPSHVIGHIAVNDTLAEAWHAGIGAGGGYRQKITAEPIIAGNRVFVMDSAAVVTALDTKTGSQLWRTETADPDADSTNVGGGIAFDGGKLFVATGLAEALALDAATGKVTWRVRLPTAARAAPTIADGKLFIPTLDSQILALAAADGKRVWGYQAPSVDTSVLGLPSPAFAEGLVVAGFGGGDLICLRAGSGAVSWTDSLASARGRASLVDLSAINGLPVIDEGRVYATGLGGLLVSLDLRSGRRLWERDIGSDQTPCVAGDWLFVLTTDQNLVAVNRQDGAIAWITQLPHWETPEKQEDPIRWLGPTLAGDRLIVASSNSQALAVSPYIGKILGTQKLSGAASVAPVAADGTVYIVTDDGTLLALR